MDIYEISLLSLTPNMDQFMVPLSVFPITPQQDQLSGFRHINRQLLAVAPATRNHDLWIGHQLWRE